MIRHALLGFALALALALPSSALAQAKTSIQVLVASVSNADRNVDDALKGMAQDFKQNGLAYTSFKLVSRNTLQLAPSETGEVKLPNGAAKVTLLKVEGSSAKVKVSSPGSTSELSMTPGGEAYIDAGSSSGQRIFLAVKR